MATPREWLSRSHESIVLSLAELVAIPSISTDGEHLREIERTAQLTCEQMRDAGLDNVQTLRVPGSLPYAYGEWLGATDKPTVFLYAHHDVQPVNYIDQWRSDPWKLTRRDGRLFGRGAADDKGAIAAQLGAISALMKTQGELPVNVKMVVEGEEEVGSINLQKFFEVHRQRIDSDVIVVCDTENIEVGVPSLTYSLRGIVALRVKVRSATTPVHSGIGGGLVADAALALNVILSRLYWGNGSIPVPRFYDKVRPLTEQERTAIRRLPYDEASVRADMGVLPNGSLAIQQGFTAFEQAWRRPCVTVIAQEASSLRQASNQVLPTAEAIVSCRIVPDQDPEEVLEQLRDHLTKDPPWDVEVTAEPIGSPVGWWITDPNGPAFEAALGALRQGFDRDPVAIGCGGSIGFVGPLAELFGGAPALLIGIEDPSSNAHAPNESLHEGDFHKVMASLVGLFEQLGRLEPGQLR